MRREGPLSPRKIDRYDIGAIIEHSNLKMLQDVDNVADNEGTWRALGKGHTKVETDIFLYRKEIGDVPERIHYWWKILLMSSPFMFAI